MTQRVRYSFRCISQRQLCCNLSPKPVAMKTVNVGDPCHWSSPETLQIKFHNFINDHHGVTSPAFDAAGFSWRLKVIKVGYECIELELSCTHGSKPIGVKLRAKSEKLVCQSKGEFDAATGHVRVGRLGVLSAVLEALDENGALIIGLELQVLVSDWKELQNMCGTKCTTSFLWQLLESNSGDVEFALIHSKTIKAHSFILSLRSPHLKELLETRTGNDGAIPVSFNEGPFRKLLQYLYTEQLRCMGSKEDAMDVLQIANHFQCYGLKHAAEIELLTYLSWETALDLASYAEAHCCPLLLEESSLVISRNLDKICMNSTKWEALRNDSTRLAQLGSPTEPRVKEIYQNLAKDGKLCSVDGTKEMLMKEFNSKTEDDEWLHFAD